MYRIFMYLLGLILASWGIVVSIVFLALIDIGYTFQEYIQFMGTRVETYFIFIGILLMVIAIFIKSRKANTSHYW